MPFELQMSNLNDQQFQFLDVNGHVEKFIRATTSRQWNRVTQEVQQKALDFFLVESSSYETEDMAVALLKTGLAYRGTKHVRESENRKVAGEVIHWAAERGYTVLMERILQDNSHDLHVLDQDGMNAMHITCQQTLVSLHCL
jgi:hypothetical protein